MFFKNSKNIKIDKNFSFFLLPTKQFDRATPKSLNKPSNTLYGHQRTATRQDQTLLSHLIFEDAFHLL